MEPDWKVIARLTADRKYYAGVLASFLKHPPEPVAGMSRVQQQQRMAEIVKRLDLTLAMVRSRKAHCGG